MDFWVAHPIRSGDGPSINYAAWLRGGSPDMWHEAALSLWMHGFAPIFRFIRQPKCDTATVIALFFRFCGLGTRLTPDRSHVDQSDWQGRDLIDELRERLRAEFYARREIAVDGVRASERTFGVDAPLLNDEVLKRRLEGPTLNPAYPSKHDGKPDEWLRELT